MALDLRSRAYQGLSQAEVMEKQTKAGFNELPSSKPKSVFVLAWGVVKEPMFLLLVACGTLYLVLGDIQEGLMLLGFVFVIMGIEFYQEKKTEKALDALKDLASPRALVIREGVEKRIAGREVVTNDLVVLQEGDRVPADATVLYAVNLGTDESLLTGESVPVSKIGMERDRPERIQPGGDGLPFVYSGSMIVAGSGVVKVTAIASDTEIGKIGKALESVQEEPTKLKTEMGILVRRLAILGVSLCLVVILVYTLSRGRSAAGFSRGDYPRHGHAARGISCCTDGFFGSGSLEDVKKKCAHA